MPVESNRYNEELRKSVALWLKENSNERHAHLCTDADRALAGLPPLTLDEANAFALLVLDVYADA